MRAHVINNFCLLEVKDRITEIGVCCGSCTVLSLGNVGGKMKKNLLTYLLLLQLCFVPESSQPPSSDALLPQKKGGEKIWVISVF